MTSAEAEGMLRRAKWVMYDMRLIAEAADAERVECLLASGVSAKTAHKYADYILPRGYRGHVRLVLLSPQRARATAFIAAILRAIEEP